MKNFSILGLSLVGLFTVISAAAHNSVAGRDATKNQSNAAQAVVDPNGNLRVPVDYRTSYQFLGSWAIANDKGQGS